MRSSLLLLHLALVCSEPRLAARRSLLLFRCVCPAPWLAGGGNHGYYRVVMAQKMSRVWPVLLAGGFALAVEASAATNNPAWSARVWQSDDGLPGNSVSGVVQTPDG